MLVILLLFLGGLLFLYDKKLGLRRKSNKKIPPGPLGLPLVGYLPFLGPLPAMKLTELSKKYGDIFSVYFGRQLVVILNNVEDMKELGKMDVFMGRNQLEIIRPYRENCGLIFLEKEGWVEWRRFTLKSLKDMGFGKNTMENLIMDQVEDFCDYLGKNENRPLSVKDAIEVAAVNALWVILTGEKMDLEDPEKRRIVEEIFEGVSDQSVMGFVTFLPWLAKMFPNLTGWNKALKLLGAPLGMSQEILKRHTENFLPGRENDFLDVAIAKIKGTTDPNSSFYGEVGMKNLLYSLLDLLFTGSDTISSTLGWAFVCLAAHPEMHTKIREEIETVVGDYNTPSLVDRSKMVYTEAFMMEVLRKSSLLPFGAMHTALEDAEFQGFRIPKRTVIIANLYGVHHDPGYWGDPQCFRPERFINPQDRTLRKEPNLIPFFTGKRSCPGESLAMNEFFLFLTVVVSKFDVELADKSVVPDLGPRPGFVVRPPDHKVILRRRAATGISSQVLAASG